MMNVCLVDDQRAVVDSLKNGIHWEKLPVDKVYTACSAREAKLILKNFPVDVLLSDIEMPEEDGISLCLMRISSMPERRSGWEALITFCSRSVMRMWRKHFSGSGSVSVKSRKCRI